MALALVSYIAKPIRIAPKLSVQAAFVHYRDAIGKREVVGFGFNGQPSYVDRNEFPFPAIRWKEPNEEINALRKKEKEDWHKMTLCDKKLLYRASFCQTYAEFNAPTGEWKSVIGVSFALMSSVIWFYYWLKVYVYPPMPVSFDEDHRRAQFRRMLDIEAQPITGLASKWDYVNDDWKK